MFWTKTESVAIGDKSECIFHLLTVKCVEKPLSQVQRLSQMLLFITFYLILANPNEQLSAFIARKPPT